MPDFGDDDVWVTVEASDDGRFFGTGASTKQSGDEIFYISLNESDLSLDVAVQAAVAWAKKYNVPKIWVQATPS